MHCDCLLSSLHRGAEECDNRGGDDAVLSELEATCGDLWDVRGEMCEWQRPFLGVEPNKQEREAFQAPLMGPSAGNWRRTTGLAVHDWTVAV